MTHCSHTVRTRILAFAFVIGSLVIGAPGAIAGLSWDLATDYSTSSNPTGPWSLGRKFSPEGLDFTVLNVRWNDGRGTTGWYLGNFGHGGPSVADSAPYLWAKNNSNGLPVVRWTSPFAGNFDVGAIFTGADSRGVDNRVFVVVDNHTVFSDIVSGALDTSEYVPTRLHLDAGDTVDFLLSWNGGVYSEYGWTKLAATIAAVPGAVPEPVTHTLMLLGLGLLGLRRCIGA